MNSFGGRLTQFAHDPWTLNASSLHVYLDMTSKLNNNQSFSTHESFSQYEDQQVSYVMQSVLLNSTETFLREILSSFGIDPSIVDPPVIIEKPIYGDLVPNFLNFAAPGIMVSIIFFLAIGLTALIFVVEKKEGLFERSWIAGVTTVEVMLAHLVVKFLIQAIQIILLLTFTTFVFHVRHFLLNIRRHWRFRLGTNSRTSDSSYGIDFSSRHLWNELW